MPKLAPFDDGEVRSEPTQDVLETRWQDDTSIEEPLGGLEYEDLRKEPLLEERRPWIPADAQSWKREIY